MAKKKKGGIVSEFRAFIMRGNVIDLAVGVIIGGAFQTIVKSLVDDIIMPLVAAIFGEVNFSEVFVTLNNSVITYGNFISAIINFLILAVIIFLIVKGINKLSERANALKKKEEEEEAEPTTKVCPFCKTEISIEATRCPHCTSQLEE